MAQSCGPTGCQIGPCFCSSINLLVDTGFENGCANWKFSSAAFREFNPGNCGNSNYNGILEENGVASQYIYQDIQLPTSLVYGPGVSSGELIFTLDVDTEEAPGGFDKDRFFIQIRDTSNKIIQTLLIISSSSVSSYQCAQVRLPLNGNYFPGQSIRVYFRGTFNNNDLWTAFRIDRVYFYPNCG
jgi:hypothetical protein